MKVALVFRFSSVALFVLFSFLFFLFSHFLQIPIAAKIIEKLRHVQYLDFKIRYEVVRAPSPWKLDYLKNKRAVLVRITTKEVQKRKKMTDSKTHWSGLTFSTVLFGLKHWEDPILLANASELQRCRAVLRKDRPLLYRSELMRVDANGAAQHRASWSGMVRSGATRIL